VNIQATPVQDLFERLMQNEEEDLEIKKEMKDHSTQEHDPLPLVTNKIESLATNSSLFENKANAFLHSFQPSSRHTTPLNLNMLDENKENVDDDSSDEEVVQIIALPSNMIQKSKFGISNGQRYQATQRNFNNANFNRNCQTFHNLNSN
jgi:vacuolar-type H+-ATPase subunit I/STV1